MKMKILHVFDFFSPVHGGGTVDLLYRVALSQSRRGHEVVIYTSDFELDRDFINSVLGVAVHPFPSWLRIGVTRVTPGIIPAARKNLKDFDIIHLHCFRSFQNVVIHHYAKKHGTPYILDAHGSTPRLATGNNSPMVFFKWLYDVFFGYQAMRDADRLIAQTQVGVDEYSNLGADEEKVTLIHPPIDIDEFKELPKIGTFRSRYNIGSLKVVMFLGRINWIKGIDFLVKSFAQMASQTQDLLLVIVGPDDGYQKTVEELIEGLGIGEKVLFTGFLNGEEKLAALVDADILVQPSIYEQAARASLEAMMCNTPVVVSKNTGAGEYIQRMDGGDVVEYGDTDGLIKAIKSTLDNLAAAQVRTQKAREYIKSNVSVASQTEKYEEVYREVIRNSLKSIKKSNDGL